MGQVIKNLGWGGDVLDARLGSASGADSNDPKFLDWDGENYVYLPGVNGNYLSVPDEAALDITGDIDIRVQVALDDWTPAATQILTAKRESGTQISWHFQVTAAGFLEFRFSTNGTTTEQSASTSTIGLSDGSVKWVRVTRSKTAGEVKFYTSDDGSSYSQLGSTITGKSTSDIFVSTSKIEIGTYLNGTSLPLTAKVYRAQVFDGIDGNKVLDIDTSVVSGDSTTFTALTGQTVTVNRSTSGRKAVCVTHPVWLFGTDDYMEVSDNALIDFGASDSFTVLAVVRQWDNTVSFGRYLDKSAGATDGLGWTLSGRTDNTLYAGIDDGPNVAFRSAISPFVVGATSVVGLVVDRTLQTLATFSDGNVGATTSTSAVGSIANSLPLRIGRTADTSGYQHFEGTAFAVFRRALTAGEIATLNSYFQGREGA